MTFGTFYVALIRYKIIIKERGYPMSSSKKAAFVFPGAAEVSGNDRLLEDEFRNLVREKSGFAMVLGYIDWVDHCIGGIDDRVWYSITDGKRTDFYLASYENGTWHDELVEDAQGKPKITKIADGTTIGMIVYRSYFGQAMIKVDGRKGMAVTDAGLPCIRYNYSFGARAYDISDEFGVTVRFSDIDHVEAGYCLRNILTGNDVKCPVMKQ